jgi:preprotein translocase SecE subunit
MAMSVAEQPVTEKVPRNPQTQLAHSSLLGAIYVLLSLWVVFGGLPYFWGESLGLANEFLSGALLLIATAVVGSALWYAGYQLEKAHARHGLRAGIFFGALLIYLALWIALRVVGSFLESRGDLGAAGAVITAAIGLGLLYGVYWVLTKPGFGAWIERVEDRGWLHALPYKPTQGVRVRRGTVLAVLALGCWGIFTLISHRSLGYETSGGPPNNWEWSIPFTGEDVAYDLFIPLMFKVHVVVPLILGVALLWLAWRVVNWPTFADFLIATEAEMNKVSWTTRKRLVQDTIVVLVTVFLLTAFLFVVDIVWIKVLSNPWFQVLHVDLKAEQQKQQEKSQW